MSQSITNLLVGQRRAGRADASKYAPHTPHPKQAEFLALDCKEALYGGAAGGGKTDALLKAALRWVHVPGYSALLLRRTFPELIRADGLVPRAHEWLSKTDAVWSEKHYRYSFPSGATLEFGHCQHERDKYNYQGAAYQFLGIDQLDQWLKSQYTYLLSRLRRLRGSPVPTVARSSANPGSIGHEWIEERFMGPNAVGVFVPALLEDNPSLDLEDYDASLRALDPITYEQLRHGKWIRDTAGLVYKYSHALNWLDIPPAKAARRKLVFAIDFGVTNACAFTVLSWEPENETLFVLKSYRKEGCDPEDAAQEVFKLIDEFGEPEKIVGDEGGLGKGFAEYFRRRYVIPIEPAEKTNKLGYQKLLNGDLERGRVKLFGTECGDLVEELGTLHKAEGKENEGDKASTPNHCCDSLLYGWRASRHWQAKKPERPKALSPAELEQRIQQEHEARIKRRAHPWWK